MPRFALLCCALPGFAQLVTDNATKVELLKAAFPGSHVVLSTRAPLDWRSSAWPGQTVGDALEGEKEYEVVAPPDRAEEAFAMPTVIEDFPRLDLRRVRFKAYRLPASDTAERYAAVAHYQFSGVKTHPFCCGWFTRVFLLTRKGGGWTVRQTGGSLTYRGKAVRSFDVLELGATSLVALEAECTAAGYRRWFTMSIFNVAEDELRPWAQVETLSTEDDVHTQFKKELDLEKTRRSGGAELYFRVTEYREGQAPKTHEEIVHGARAN